MISHLLASLAALTSTALALPATTPVPPPVDDPALAQVIERDQPTVTGRATLGSGHVDLGPRVVDGAWSLQIHDGTASPSVWRPLSDAVLTVPDVARREVPDDPAYAFLPAKAGEQVYVLPQTQDPAVVWLGWNTQDPGVTDALDRGVTLSLRAVEGPGDLVVYLQSGNLGGPQTLWDSRRKGDQGLYVDLDTHTHANWVFSDPGTYLVHLGVSGQQRDGTPVSADGVLRVAVGGDTDVQQAFELTPAVLPAPGTPPTAPGAAPAAEQGGATGRTWLIGSGGAAAVLLVVGLLTARRSRRARLLAEAS